MSGVQKLRVCGSEEDELILRISVLITVIVSSCLSLGAALWLNHIIDYVKLFKATKTLLLCIPTNPVVHRNALFSMVSSDEEKDLQTLTEMTSVKNAGTVINRPNSKGESPFQLACSNNDEWKAMLLWTAGAKPNPKDAKSCEFLMKHANLHPLGIQHVIECDALVDLLETWSNATNEEKEEVEQKIKDLFGDDLKLIFISTLHMAEEKRRKLRGNVMEWNRDHDMKVMASAPEGSFSDRKMAEGKKLTGIAIKESESGNFITRIRARYDDVWTDWRTTGDIEVGKEEILPLEQNEDIVAISGYSWDKYGYTATLQAESSAGRSWGPFGDHKPSGSNSLRSSPSAPRNSLRLKHISGDQTYEKYILRFHWEPRME